jgi:HEPN domain-containing protein
MFVGLGRVEEFEVLLRRSESFYVTALLQAERGMYDLAVFSLEQSLQLFLKAALLKKGVDFPRTHGVRRLLNMLAELTGSDEIKQLQTSTASSSASSRTHTSSQGISHAATPARSLRS